VADEFALKQNLAVVTDFYMAEKSRRFKHLPEMLAQAQESMACSS
jgi:hypothetical protein